MDGYTLFCIFLFGFLRAGLSCRRYVPDVDVEEIDDIRKLVAEQDLPFYMNRVIKNYTKMQNEMEEGCTCGTPNEKPQAGSVPTNRVTGGVDAGRHEFPWQVALAVKNTRVSICGGSLINSHFILTAAHCVIDTSGGVVFYAIKKLKNLQILLNAHNLNIPSEVGPALDDGVRWKPEELARRDDEDGVIRREVAEVIVHPGYTFSLTEYQSKQFEDDIALIRLDRPVNLTNSGGPYTVCLPDTDEYQIYKDVIALIIGWGKTTFGSDTPRSPATTLQKLDIPIRPLEQCRDLNRKFFRISFHFICIGSNNRDMDAGVGDSGGPLMIRVGKDTPSDHYVQIGLSSFQNMVFQRSQNAYSAYSRVAEFIPWIYSHTQKKQKEKVKWCKRIY